MYGLCLLLYRMKDSQNPIAQFVLKCLICCLWCLEKFLKFLNEHAYIVIGKYWMTVPPYFDKRKQVIKVKFL